MNNFELDRRAQELAASHTSYNLARRLVALEEELQDERREKSAIPSWLSDIASQLYQACGAYDMPDRVMDVLSDLQGGERPKSVDILPVHSPQQAQRERSPSDYAIEHAGYMATAAEALISGLNKNSVDGEDYFSIDDDILDSIRTLNNRVYEFQKRRDRALSIPPATAAWAEVYEALGRTDEPSFPAPAAVPERVKDLVSRWRQEHLKYPASETGWAAATVIRCCAAELEDLIDTIYDSETPQ